MQKIRKLLKKDLENISEKLEEDELSDEDLLKIIENYQEFAKKSRKLSQKCDKMEKFFEEIYNDAKKIVYPDESNWKKWNGRDFVRFHKNIGKHHILGFSMKVSDVAQRDYFLEPMSENLKIPAISHHKLHVITVFCLFFVE